VRASRMSAGVSVGPGMSGPASQICAYRKSDRSTPPICAGTPPDRLKCKASTRTDAFERLDCATTWAAWASVRTPV
jgi:hypothetical protein